MQEQLHFLASGGPITVGTACSGTEIIMVVLAQLLKYWSEDAGVVFPPSPISLLPLLRTTSPSTPSRAIPSPCLSPRLLA